MHMTSSLPGVEPQANQGDCKKGGAKLRIFLRGKGLLARQSLVCHWVFLRENSPDIFKMWFILIEGIQHKHPTPSQHHISNEELRNVF